METREIWEEASEQLEETSEMEVDKEGEGKGQGNLRALKSIGFLTQEAYLRGTTHVYACNSFIELSRLAILWTVRNFCP